MTRQILITGAAGFIGSHMAEHLLKSGYSVTGLDNLDDYYPVSIKEENLKLLEKNNFNFIQGDIRDASLLDKIFTRNKYEAVIHLAARAGVRPSVDNPMIYQDVNVMGTVNLLQSCRNHGINKFLFASSSSVYGINESMSFTEDINVNFPVSPYAASKASAELFCRTFSHLYGISMVVLRFFTVYGPRQRPEMAIHKFTNSILNNGVVKIFGDGTAVRDYTYIDDAVAGITAALSYGDKTFQIFNIGAGKKVSLNYLLEVLQNSLQKKARIEYEPPFPGDVPLTLADISKAQALLGYNPRFNIEEGVNNFVKWYKENKET